MNPLVSVIIPCYDAERWVAEAVRSCLEQTYQPLEIIVIDDGSTDKSLEILRSFGSAITIETGENRGGNHARNRGFALSSGRYIQFLDADDYLLPEKIARQVAFLETTGADAVYGDWRHRHHRPNGKSYLDKVVCSGAHDDVLEALLSRWWVAPATLLFKREVVGDCGGWDESLRAAQDTDFIMRVALAGAKILYQPGCFAVYRRYGNVTVSTSNISRWLESHCRVLNTVEAALANSQRLTTRYKQALAISYFYLARVYYDVDKTKYKELLDRVLTLHPEFQPHETLLYNTTQRWFGFMAADRLDSGIRRFRNT
jgi:glycosyltransferase involved in cell wall biosynthesis